MQKNYKRSRQGDNRMGENDPSSHKAERLTTNNIGPFEEKRMDVDTSTFDIASNDVSILSPFNYCESKRLCRFMIQILLKFYISLQMKTLAPNDLLDQADKELRIFAMEKRAQLNYLRKLMGMHPEEPERFTPTEHQDLADTVKLKF